MLCNVIMNLKDSMIARSCVEHKNPTPNLLLVIKNCEVQIDTNESLQRQRNKMNVHITQT